MKRLFSFLLMLICWFAAMAADWDYIYLNNGNVVKGTIESIEPNISVTIRDRNGNFHTYNMVEVKKMTKKAPEIPKVGTDKDLTRLRALDNGFWYATELMGGYSCRTANANSGLAEIDVTAGYRFNQWARVGLGLGFRYYFNSENIRYCTFKGSFPIYLNVRGNLAGDIYRSITPYYSFDIGGAIRDGFMLRPTVGVRFGTSRSAFLLGISYMAQSVPTIAINVKGELYKKQTMISFLNIRFGYEF